MGEGQGDREMTLLYDQQRDLSQRFLLKIDRVVAMRLHG